MKAHRTRLGPFLAAIAIAAAVPSSAAAAAYVPPGNSAATQYTEALPTAGGPKATDKSKQGQKRSPNMVLGAHNTEKLDAHGPQGHAAAEVAAETAPSATAAQTAAKPEASGSTGHNDSKGSNSNAGYPAPPQDSSGSSGFGEVVSQATGSSSSGQLGLLLPLLIIGVVALSIAYLLRQRKRPAG
ncbi:MAG TPA: hypothetical protein VN756_07920 [Solirubrobacterales bacterium]|nr:hypothetical protein [Solirubrobacterales bacterium]